MTLILKSNVAIRQNKLRDAVQDPVLSLDFRDGEYIKNGSQETSLGSLVKATGPSGGYYTPLGKYYTSNPSTPRISSELDSYNKGLLIENPFYNLFLDGFNPVSQTITYDATDEDNVVVEVYGSGSAKVTFDGEFMGVATEGNIVSTPAVAKNDVVIDIEIVGELDYVGVIKSRFSSPVFTRLSRGSYVASRNPDKFELDPSLLASLLPNFKGCVVLRQYIPKPWHDKEAGIRKTIAIATVVDSANKGFYVAKGYYAPYQTALRAMVESETITESYEPVDNKVVTALNFSKTGAKLAINGNIVGESVTAQVDLSRVILGSTSTWSKTETNLVQEVLLFDRHLSDDELKAVTKS